MCSGVSQVVRHQATVQICTSNPFTTYSVQWQGAEIPGGHIRLLFDLFKADSELPHLSFSIIHVLCYGVISIFSGSLQHFAA